MAPRTKMTPAEVAADLEEREITVKFKRRRLQIPRELRPNNDLTGHEPLRVSAPPKIGTPWGIV